MTDISVVSTAFNAEDLSWDLTPDLDARYKSSATIDVSKFTPADHYPNGYLKSGIVLQHGAGGLLEPYAAGGSVAGILAASVQVINSLNGQPKTRIGIACLEAFAVVKTSRLPVASGKPGAIDDAAKSALPRIHFVA